MKMKTKDLVLAALFTAISLLIPILFPRLEMGPFSATFASHVPVFIAMFVSPLVAFAAGIGSMLGFFLKGAPIYIVARAAMHIILGIVGAFMLKKRTNIWIVGTATMIVHALLETVAVMPFLFLVPLDDNFTWYQLIIIGTSIHHVIDFVIAVLIVKVLDKTGLFKEYRK